ncbi:unnamed protein product [Withania somnifera]
MRKTAPGWDIIDNSAYSTKGRIWIIWDPQMVTCTLMEMNKQYIHTEVVIEEMNIIFTFTAVYGLHTINDRRSLWAQLKRIHSGQQEPWLVMGDYYTFHRDEDRIVESTVPAAEIRDFDEFMRDKSISILKYKGREFAGRMGTLTSRIDWALVNTSWMLAMPNLELLIMDPGCSDHTPLSFNFPPEVDMRPRPFKFLSHLTKHENFQHIRDGLARLWQKLKGVKQALKHLNATEYQGVQTRIKMYRHLHGIQSSMRQGTLIISSMGIEEVVIGFYKQLLGLCVTQLLAVNPLVMRDGPSLSRGEHAQLIETVTSEEIFQALQGIDDSKAWGYDGFNSFFFKKMLTTVGDEIMEAVKEFFSTLTLVPRIAHPSKISEYRPISCCTILYNIISKVLTNRMQHVMERIIDKSPSAFVLGRLINDSIILSNELVKGYIFRASSGPIEVPWYLVAWIVQCIRIVSYSILINGYPNTPFEAKKGLRQGDPLSPYLFVLCMEYFTKLLKKLRQCQVFKYHPKCDKM